MVEKERRGRWGGAHGGEEGEEGEEVRRFLSAPHTSQLRSSFDPSTAASSSHLDPASPGPGPRLRPGTEPRPRPSKSSSRLQNGVTSLFGSSVLTRSELIPLTVKLCGRAGRSGAVIRWRDLVLTDKVLGQRSGPGPLDLWTCGLAASALSARSSVTFFRPPEAETVDRVLPSERRNFRSRHNSHFSWQEKFEEKSRSFPPQL